MENKWFPAHTHSYSSLLDSNSKPSDIVKRCLELGYTSCAVTDHGNISSSIEFHDECTKAGIKPVLGSEFYMSQQHSSVQDKTNPNHAHLCILAKNKSGWSNLVRATSEANKPNHFYHKPRLSLEQFAPFGKDIIAFSGHIGSEMANILFEEPKLAYRSDDAKSLLRPDWKARGIELAGRYKEIFDTFMLEVQLIDSDNIASTSVIGECIREISRATNIPCIATGDSHYCTKVDAADQRISLCTSFRTTLNKVYNSIANDEDVTLSGFFNSNNYHIPSIEELLKYNTQEEIYNTYLLQEMCEKYKLQEKPKIPKYSDNDNYLITEKCRAAIEHIEYHAPKNTYIDRMNYELSVIHKYDLSGYFLIVQDYINWARNQGCLVGPGRGCLSYDTVIVTPNGYKKISEINIGDKVITRDGQINKVRKLWKYECDEKLLKINCFYGDTNGLKLTTDHEILSQKAKITQKYLNNPHPSYKKYENPTNELVWLQAKDLEVGDWVFTPYTKQKYCKTKTFDLSKYSDKNSKRLYFDKEKVYHAQINGLTKTVNRLNVCDRKITLTEDLGYVLGYFIGNGWFRSDDSVFGVGFACNNDKLNHLHFINNYFKQLGCNTSILPHKTKHVTQLIVRNYYIDRLFRDIFKNYKSIAITKYIPSILMNTSQKIRKRILDGILDSDGNRSKDKISISSCSDKVIYGVKSICVSLNIPCSITQIKRIEKREGHKNYEWIEYKAILEKADGKNNGRVRHIEGGYLCQIRSIEEINNPHGYVYDIEVENEHNYLTTNGIVHNSVGGSLVSYLLQISMVDPIQYGLIFERFYNEGRNSGDHIELPDIDTDFPKGWREKVIEYIRGKYGNVYHIITFSRLKGRSAIKSVLSAHEACTPEEMNAITKFIPDEAKISDQLQIMKEAGEEPSIIQWALENEAENLKEWAYLTPNGVEGPFGKYFEQAMRIEGTKKSASKHASGIVVSIDPIDDQVPIVYDPKNKEPIVGFEMNDVAKCGILKLDILGLKTLNVLQGIQDILRNEFVG